MPFQLSDMVTYIYQARYNSVLIKIYKPFQNFNLSPKLCSVRQLSRILANYWYVVKIRMDVMYLHDSVKEVIKIHVSSCCIKASINTFCSVKNCG